jgi:hypothetical protein
MRAAVLIAALTLLPLAGCVSGSSSSSTTATAPVGTISVTGKSAPSPTATLGTTKPIPSSNGAGTAILPAEVSVDAGGNVKPPVVSGPVDTTIELQVSSLARHPVTVEVASRSLTVPPLGHASIRLAGLKAGRYAIVVDGDRRAALVIGAQPGP